MPSTNMEDAGQQIAARLLSDESDMLFEDDEQAEVSSARSILDALGRLKSSITNLSPDQQHDITTIEASAHSILRMHEAPAPLDKELFRSSDPTQ